MSGWITGFENGPRRRGRSEGQDVTGRIKRDRVHWRGALALVAGLWAAAPVVAQDAAAPEPAAAPAAGDLANGTAFGDWVVSCEAVTTQRNVCRLVQELSRRDTGELVARFIALPVEDGAVLVAQVPMGVFLPGGAVYRFADRDDLEQRDMIWQRCLGEVCEAAAPLDTAELKLFGENKAILFGFRTDAEAEPVIVRVDISQFVAGLDRLAAAQKQN